VAATPGFRIEWTTDVGKLLAVEPRPDEVRAHAVELAAGYNEPENARHMGHDEHISEFEVVDHYVGMRRKGAHLFLLYLDGTLVGDADLRGSREGAAEFAFMIAARNQQGKGLGTKFAFMVHAYAFSVVGLERVYASIAPDNRASRRVFEKLGYAVDEGPEARAFADEAADVMMVIERAPFEAAHSTALAQVLISQR
jgi:RimJ/RimL family protein N-acetyltransferase